ncbi:MAG: shikimate kinase [Candidatus Omnitrophica bacterium]|nr:shikimate kinase [Candidatus Omnitrophota bacterium]
MKNIYLVGFMGTGKTTAGQIVAETLHKEFLETDERIEQEQGKKISEIFATQGQAYFRTLEKELLAAIASKTDRIVSCGGGLICDEDNIRIMRASGTIITLKASPKTIYERTKKYTHRPLLNVKDPLSVITKLLAEREVFYSRAHFSVDTENIAPPQVAAAIIKIANNIEGR